MWSSARPLPGDPFYDIQEVEGIGPLIALTTWRDVLTDALWLHFIDNNSALSCLTKGGVACTGHGHDRGNDVAQMREA